jgi:drug/metabolite transporter (DMT)-like permease
MKKRNGLVYLLLFLTMLLWGSQYIFNKILLEAIPNSTLLCLRFLLSAVAMTVIQKLRRPESFQKPRKFAKKDWKFVVLYGIVAYVLSAGLQQLGVKYAGAGLSSLICCLNPIAICLFAVLFLHERMTVTKGICIGSAVAGAICIVGGDAGNGHLAGILFSLASVVSWGLISVFIRSFTQKYDALTLTTYGVYIAAILTLPVMVWQLITMPELDFLHTKYILCLLFVALLGTAAAHTMWNYSLAHLEASSCSVFYPVQPLISTTLGVLLLHERVTLTLVIGAALILFGLLYYALKKDPVPATPKRKQ